MSAFAGPICVVPPHAVETASGVYVDVVTPEPSTINIHDVAWALSRQARFAGHTLSEEVWNVAQHSLFVEELVTAALEPEDNYDVITSLRAWMFDRGYPTFEKELYLPRVQMGALLHDSTEAYLIDLPSPVKRHDALREPYKALERGLFDAVYQGLDVDPPRLIEHEVIVWADLLALQIEASILMPSRGRGWSGTLPHMDPIHLHLFPMQVKPWKLAYQDFMHRFKQLYQDL